MKSNNLPPTSSVILQKSTFVVPMKPYKIERNVIYWSNCYDVAAVDDDEIFKSNYGHKIFRW